MPFPFVPIGAVVATAVLVGAFCLLYLVITKLDRAIVEVGGGVVGRLVSGFDDWNHERPGRGRPSDDTPIAGPPATPFEEASAIPVERSRRD